MYIFNGEVRATRIGAIKPVPNGYEFYDPMGRCFLYTLPEFYESQRPEVGGWVVTLYGGSRRRMGHQFYLNHITFTALFEKGIEGVDSGGEVV